MKVKLFLILVSITVILAGVMAASTMATQNKGAENIELAGSIKALKAEGKLKKKHVMNKLCTKCHKQKKKAGQKSGPTTCKKCHIKGK